MKNKSGKILSISLLIIGYVSCMSWAVIELAKYYGWQSLFNNSVFMFVYKTYLSFTKSGIAWFYTYFISFGLFVSLGVFSIKCLKEKRLNYYRNNRTEIKVSKDASFYDKAYDEFTPVSAYNNQNTEIDLESQYDYLINK